MEVSGLGFIGSVQPSMNFASQKTTERCWVLSHRAWRSVAQAAEEAEKAAGAPIKVTGFVRFALGEGVEKKSGDFAAEVAAAVGGTR